MKMMMQGCSAAREKQAECNPGFCPHRAVHEFRLFCDNDDICGKCVPVKTRKPRTKKKGRGK